MKKVFLKDIREILPAVVRMAVAFVVLELVILVAFAEKNASLISTGLYMFVFALALSALYLLYSAGRSFLGNLRSETYYKELSEQGVSRVRAVLCKIAYYIVALWVFLAVYAAALALDVSIFKKNYPEAWEPLAEKLNAEGTLSFTTSSVVSTVFEYMTAASVLVALVFFAVIISFTFAMRHRFTGIGSVLLYLFFFGAFMKFYKVTIKGRRGVELHITAAVMQVVLTAVLIVLTILILEKKTFPKEIKKRPGEV